MTTSTASLSLDQLSIDTLRMLAVDSVEKAKSGHPGAPLGCAPIAYVLFHKVMKHNPAHSKWADRDRFVLSNGHASMLLYGTLFLTGYKVTLDDLKSFRQFESKTPGHPEYGVTDGVEVTTGPLGQGFGMGVGMAIAEKHLAATYNRQGFNVVDHHTYMGVINPALAAHIAWGWFLISQVTYGLTAGIVVARQERIPTGQSLPFAERLGVETPGLMQPRPGAVAGEDK